jgi:hypothetical protein
MSILSQIANAMQDVLTEKADIIAKETQVVQRQRKVSGSNFIQTLVFGWLDNPEASLEELVQTASDVGLDISAQGLDKRFDQKASDFMKKVLELAVSKVIFSDPAAIPILNRFNGVYIQDGSLVSLPDELSHIFPGCGNGAKKISSSVRFQVRWNLTNGQISELYIHPGKEHERSAEMESLPAGSLRIADLGYFSLDDFQKMNDDGVYWLSRVKSQCDVYDTAGKKWDLLDFLEKYCEDQLDVFVYLGANRVPCRLLACVVPDEVVQARLRKLKEYARTKGVTPSKKLLKLARWTIMCTNVSWCLLTLMEALVVMKARWQIEMLFKLWKSYGVIDEWRTENPWRILCEFYGKLIVMIIQHWIFLSCCWQYPERSIVKGFKGIRKHATYLGIALASRCIDRLMEALEVIQNCLSHGTRLNKRKKKPNTYQLLLESGF